MRRLLSLTAFVAVAASAQQTFTLRQALQAPYSTNLTAAPVGSRMAWVEHIEGRNNLWVYGASATPTPTPSGNTRQLTHNTDDDAQDITSLAWSPDASLLAYVYGAPSGNSGRPANPAHLQRSTSVDIYVQPVTGGDPIKIGEGRAPLFAPDGKSLFFIRNGQIMQTQLIAGKASAAEPVLFDRGTASQLTLSPDGKNFAYISHRRTHDFLALYNVETKVLTFPAPSTGNDSAPVFSRDGKQVAWLRFPYTDPSEFAGNRASPNPWSIQILDVATSQARTLFQPEANQRGSAEPRMSTGEPHLFFTGDNQVLFFSEADGWVHLYAISSSGGSSATLLTPGHYEVEDAAMDPQGRTIVYASNERGQDPTEPFEDVRHIWSVDLHAPYARKQLSTLGIETHPQIRNDGVVFALVSATDRPMFPVQLMRPSGYVSLHYPTPPDIGHTPEAFTKTQAVRFPSSDKLFQIHGQLFLPKSPEPATGKRPAILFFHGGPKRQMLLGYPAMDYYSNAYAMNQYLASRGYIVLSVNYRGGIGYGLDFRQCQHCGADGAAEYNDALGAVAYLRSRPDVDIAHIGIWGGSYGGYFTALALARNSDLFAAGVDFHGVHEWAREDNAAADWLRGPLAEQEKIAATAHASSPMADVDKWKSPVLLIHGDDDPEVAYTQTPMLADALRARNVHVEELIFPDELHGFLLHKDWLAAYEAAANFFDRTLKGNPASPNATKPH